MACTLITIFTASTLDPLCNGLGTPVNVYAETSTLPFPNATVIYLPPDCSTNPILGSFYFLYDSYTYTYEGKVSGDAVPCPSPTPTPTPTITPTPTPTITPTITPTPTPTPPVLNNYCIINTETYDGNYLLTGTYDGFNYFTGPNGFIFYSIIETRWCLSSNLGDPCVQFGPYGSTSISPDLDDTVMYEGECVTTTTTTNPCVDFDFTALFDCLVPVSPSPTPTNTPTPTPTPTPSPSDPCGGRDMIVGASGYTPTPTPTMTPTPSPSPEITRPCNFSGEAIFNAFTEILQCANSKRFTDCFTGIDYYTSDLVLTPFNTSPKEGYVYNAVINGQGVCVVFQGLFENISGVDKVVLTDEVGSSVDGSCLSCLPNLSATPTPTPTQTPTPTPSPSPCVSYQYRVKNISPLPIRIFFLSCSGDLTITLESEKSTIVCSKTLPTASSSNVEITPLNTLCI